MLSSHEAIVDLFPRSSHLFSLRSLHAKKNLALIMYLVRNRPENRKSRFSLKPVGMAELTVAAVIGDTNRVWKKEKFFSQLDLLLRVAKIEP